MKNTITSFLDALEAKADERTRKVIAQMRERPISEYGFNAKSILYGNADRVTEWVRRAAETAGASQRAFITEALAYANGRGHYA